MGRGVGVGDGVSVSSGGEVTRPGVTEGAAVAGVGVGEGVGFGVGLGVGEGDGVLQNNPTQPVGDGEGLALTGGDVKG